PLGAKLAQMCIDALGGDASLIEGYGKGAIVGVNGEIEHGALWHVPGGYAMRDSIEKSMAIVPSTKKVGAAGTRLDVPVTHTNASYVRTHYDAVEVGVPDAPRPNELVLVLVMTTAGRIHARIGGLTKDQIKGEDGLR
ncbi:MAG: amino acid synthesis family protein, partial [Rhodobacteraceae bacterium]|nr:amino acid synthesis family protein [Paracoccaceae bacterium]